VTFLQLCGVLRQCRSIAVAGQSVSQSVSQSDRRGLQASRQAVRPGSRNRCFYATAGVNTNPFSRRISRSLVCRIPYKQALERLGRQGLLSIGPRTTTLGSLSPCCMPLLLPVSGTLITCGSSPSSSPWVFIEREREKDIRTPISESSGANICV
jgi:hypothetical protein